MSNNRAIDPDHATDSARVNRLIHALNITAVNDPHECANQGAR